MASSVFAADVDGFDVSNILNVEEIRPASDRRVTPVLSRKHEVNGLFR